ncbi:MAG TPA: hypothetical protein DCY47_05410, partial [Candidatus Accumulibacter sp.]|nr:hypothetical protein [Accumulibacter sp.]
MMPTTTTRRALLVLACLLPAACSTTSPAEARDELANTAWRLASPADVPAAGTRVASLRFDHGRVSGSAGCNLYSATYASSAQDIRIGPAGATRRRCSAPQGIMEQEARFLDALASAATWRLDGDRLELRSATGALALSLTAAAEAATATLGAAGDGSRIYRCGEQSVRLSAGGDRLQLLPDGPGFALQAAVAASGARYVARDDERTSFWSKGDRATLIVGGRTYPECLLQHPTGAGGAAGGGAPGAGRGRGGRPPRPP